MSFAMSDFWIPRLSTSVRARRSVRGWSHADEGLSTFLEAPLSLGQGFGDADPHSSDMVLVSAPGAVGKSTLARQIAYCTGAIIIDLAEAAAVGASTITGGLARAGLYEAFLEGDASVIVDGLDEARIRVTQDGFLAFIEDLVDLVSNRGKDLSKPVVLFGRTGAVDEAWLLLSELGVETPVLEIDYFDAASAKQFSTIRANDIRGRRHEPDERAIELLLDQLQNQTLADGIAFTGYSPVLIAIAKRVADPNDAEFEVNTSQLISRLESGSEQITLGSIASSILEREQRKIMTLGLLDRSLQEKLYSPDEQYARLVERVYGHSLNFPLPDMEPSDRQLYENALETWVVEHPFLDGAGRRPSSAVFGGLIAAKALTMPEIAKRVLHRELNVGSLVNPFLAEFYIGDLREKANGSNPNMPSEHIGLIYASLCARLSAGETASLRIESEEFDTQHQATRDSAEVEIVIEREKSHSLDFTTAANGNFWFGRRVQDVAVIAPSAGLSIGNGSELTLVAPVSIDVNRLELNGDKVTVEQPAHRARDDVEDVVDIVVRSKVVSQISTLPKCTGRVSLEVRWPESQKWPWSTFSVDEPERHDVRMYDGINALLRILRLFKSKGKGNLAKFCGAIDHHRRTYGLGQAMLDQLLVEEILRRSGPFYFLDPDKLMSRAGLMYNTVRGGIANDKTRAFVERALANTES